MEYKVIYTKGADKSIAKFSKSNPKAYKKIFEFIKELHEHPRTGTGHPEPLLEGNNSTYSRCITKKDRLVYNIYDESVTVLVLTAEGHYNDK
jgi:toxin YoeB